MFQKRRAESQHANTQVDLGSEIGEWVDVVGGKKRGRVYGLGLQARDAPRGEPSSSTPSNSQQSREELQNTIAALSSEWHIFYNQCSMMFNSIFDQLQIRSPFPFPPPPSTFPPPTDHAQPPPPFLVPSPTNEEEGEGEEDNDDDDEQ